MFTRVIGGAKYANQRLIQRCGWWLNVHIQGVLFKKKNCQVRSTLVGNDFGALWKDPRKKKKATLHVTERKLKVTFALHWQTRWGEKKRVSSVSSLPLPAYFTVTLRAPVPSCHSSKHPSGHYSSSPLMRSNCCITETQQEVWWKTGNEKRGERKNAQVVM